MPNFDTGHYFLTTLAPIREGTVTDKNGATVTYRQRLRERLAALPTALQSPATVRTGVNSPFSRNTRTHLCRFVVIDDVVYNGRPRTNPLILGTTEPEPAPPLPVDRLNSAYLMFAADVDAVTEDGAPLPKTLDEAGQDAVRDSYARLLWTTMESEVREIWGNCYGFEERVTDADSFAEYIARCQVETTMPFNDYWLDNPNLPEINLLPVIAVVGIPVFITLMGLLGWIGGAEDAPVIGWSITGAIWGGIALTAIAIAGLMAYVTRLGMKPMPPGQYADLPSVLKGLYIQQTFADFAIAAQGKDPETLQRDFAAWVAEHDPLGTKDDSPTQSPGVIGLKSAAPPTAPPPPPARRRRNPKPDPAPASDEETTQ